MSVLVRSKNPPESSSRGGPEPSGGAT